MTRRVKLAIAVSLVAVALYSAAYLGARRALWIVHYQGYQTDGGQMVVDSHRVEAGDPGVMGTGRHKMIASHVFAPARLLETAIWYLVRPPGSPVE